MINETDLEAFEYYNMIDGPEPTNEFLVIGQPKCSYCEKTLEVLDGFAFDYDYRSIHNLVHAERKYLEEAAGKVFKTVPQIFNKMEDGSLSYVGGYDDLIASFV